MRAALLIYVAGSVGCVTGPQAQLREQARARGLAAVGPAVLTAYRVQPGDVLTVKFFYNDELNEQLPVRPDGYLALQLVGEVKAAGLTVPELRQTLVEKYTGVLKQPEVTVIVNQFDTQMAYVGGEVARPNVIPISPYTTALGAIIMAGGPLPTSELTSVVVVRDVGTGRPDILLLNLDQALSTLADSADIALQPRDIVWVPQSLIAKIDQFVDQYIDQVLPISRSFQVNYTFGELKSDIQSARGSTSR